MSDTQKTRYIGSIVKLRAAAQTRSSPAQIRTFRRSDPVMWTPAGPSTASVYLPCFCALVKPQRPILLLLLLLLLFLS